MRNKENEIKKLGWQFDLFGHGGWVHTDVYDDGGKLRVFDSVEDVLAYIGATEPVGG